MRLEPMPNKIYCMDALQGIKQLPDESVDCIVTSPPYWGLRDYGIEGQIGLEPTLDEYLNKLLEITAELKRALKPTGVLFWNHGDCYGGSPSSGTNAGTRQRGSIKRQPKPGIYPKCLALQNHRLILRMIDEQGWILRNQIIWHKPNGMPSSVKDRFNNSYEPVFMLTKNKKYWFDLDAVRVPHKDIRDYSRHAPFNYRVREAKKGHNGIIGVKSTKEEMAEYDSKGIKVPGQRIQGMHRKPHKSNYESNGKPLVDFEKGKNPGDLWKIPTQPFPEAHFATFPEKLINPMIKAGCPESGIVLDPFMGAGTTALVARKLSRQFIGFEINPDYVKIARARVAPYINQKKLHEACPKIGPPEKTDKVAEITGVHKTP